MVNGDDAYSIDNYQCSYDETINYVSLHQRKENNRNRITCIKAWEEAGWHKIIYLSGKT
jgi:ABC-type polysaccharide transport system permease subunit